jgi:hypothetical protein
MSRDRLSLIPRPSLAQGLPLLLMGIQEALPFTAGRNGSSPLAPKV